MTRDTLLGQSTQSLSSNKVADVTLAFWVMKICATTVGETGGDMLSMTFDIGYAVSSLILISVFVIVLVIQLRSKHYHPFLFWAVILATSTAGTTISDFMDRTLNLGYESGSVILASALVSVLFVWRIAIGTLAVDHIQDRKVEVFYWLAILASNTLGTALGDYLADTSGLGFGLSNLLISTAIAATAAAYFLTRISRTALFWMAFVLTRPFGATMGDLLTKSSDKGGLGFGTIGSSIALLCILLAVIIWDMRASTKSRAAELKA